MLKSEIAATFYMHVSAGARAPAKIATTINILLVLEDSSNLLHACTCTRACMLVSAGARAPAMKVARNILLVLEECL